MKSKTKQEPSQMKHRNTIDHDLLSELEDHYNGYGNFEKIPKGEKGRQDSKRLTEKSDKKLEKEKRKQSKNGKWERLDQESTGLAW